MAPLILKWETTQIIRLVSLKLSFFYLLICSTLGIGYHPESIGKLEKYLELLTEMAMAIESVYCKQVGLYCQCYYYYFSAWVKSKDLKWLSWFRTVFLRLLESSPAFLGGKRQSTERTRKSRSRKCIFCFCCCRPTGISVIRTSPKNRLLQNALQIQELKHPWITFLYSLRPRLNVAQDMKVAAPNLSHFCTSMTTDYNSK